MISSCERVVSQVRLALVMLDSNVFFAASRTTASSRNGIHASVFINKLGPLESQTPHAGALRRMSMLLNAQPASQKDASAALCASLSDGITFAASAAVTHKVDAVRVAAVLFVGAFCERCSKSLLQRVVKRDPDAAEGQPELIARLVALVALPQGTDERQAAVATLRAVTHGVPSMQRLVLEKLLSGAFSCETEDETAAVLTGLHACLLPPDCSLTASISPGEFTLAVEN